MRGRACCNISRNFCRSLATPAKMTSAASEPSPPSQPFWSVHEQASMAPHEESTRLSTTDAAAGGTRGRARTSSARTSSPKVRPPAPNRPLTQEGSAAASAGNSTAPTLRSKISTAIARPGKGSEASPARSPGSADDAASAAEATPKQRGGEMAVETSTCPRSWRRATRRAKKYALCRSSSRTANSLEESGASGSVPLCERWSPPSALPMTEPTHSPTCFMWPMSVSLATCRASKISRPAAGAARNSGASTSWCFGKLCSSCLSSKITNSWSESSNCRVASTIAPATRNCSSLARSAPKLHERTAARTSRGASR
mmetsp:Transcript_145961/g.467972  ORF Transcript_145961/g.467972 Transcript_145961/m.467972 type:complete len:314 (+) Transcript_145961:843-1784(+)